MIAGVGGAVTIAKIIKNAAEKEAAADISFLGGNVSDADQPTNDWVLASRRPLASSTSYNTCYRFFQSLIRPGWTASGCAGGVGMYLVARQDGVYVYLNNALAPYSIGSCNSAYSVEASATVQPGITVRESASYVKRENPDGRAYTCP